MRIKENTMGIYAVIGIEADTNTAIYYIGQVGANGIAKRFSTHKSNLKSGKFYYKELCDIYANNPDNIKFEILETVEDETLLAELEHFYINRYFANVDGVIVINKNKGKKCGTSHKKFKDTTLMSKKQTGSANGHCTKLNERLASELLYLKANYDVHKMSMQQIADLYNISPGYLSQIGNCRWLSVCSL